MPRKFFELKMDHPDHPTTQSVYSEDETLLRQIGAEHHEAAATRRRPYMELRSEDDTLLASYGVWDTSWTEETS